MEEGNGKYCSKGITRKDRGKNESEKRKKNIRDDRGKKERETSVENHIAKHRDEGGK